MIVEVRCPMITREQLELFRLYNYPHPDWPLITVRTIVVEITGNTVRHHSTDCLRGAVVPIEEFLSTAWLDPSLDCDFLSDWDE